MWGMDARRGKRWKISTLPPRSACRSAAWCERANGRGRRPSPMPSRRETKCARKRRSNLHDHLALQQRQLVPDLALVFGGELQATENKGIGDMGGDDVASEPGDEAEPPRSPAPD